ncbi:MAG TPA: ABC transporter ATP-binding protein [Armatimonadota bacterium]
MALVSGSSALFEVDGVSFSHPGGTRCLEDVSFSLHSGERVALLGANGSGKSTLLHLLDALYFPTLGIVRAGGRELTERSVEDSTFGPWFRKEVGFLFQNSDAQLFCATVEEELAFGPLQLRLQKEEVLQRMDETLALLEIGHLRTRSPQALSGGEKKRVALASLLVMGPSVLLLDEPTAGLDPRSQSVLLEILNQLHQAGMTLITATHDLTLLPHLADRALVLDEAHHLAQDAPTDEVLASTELLLTVNLIHAFSHRHGTVTHRHPQPVVALHDHQAAPPSP